MKISSSYPYPVLQNENDDYNQSSFSVEYNAVPQFGELKIDAVFRLNNRGIEEYINSNKAVYLLHIECGQTSYRKVFETIENKLLVSIPTQLLRGKVTVHSFVVAKEKIKNYQNDNLNDWYKGINIAFEKGNFIAIGNAIEISLFEDNTEFMNLPSIVNIKKAIHSEFMEVDIYQNQIVISLPEYEYEQYALNANSRFKNTILAMIILPCLIEVFSKISEGREDLEEYKWYQVLEKIFTENNYKLEDVGTERLSALKATQLILRKPLKTSFEEIEKMNKLED